MQPAWRRRTAWAFTAAALCLPVLGDSRTTTAAAAFPNTMPQTVLWAWEEPEDLRTADPHTIGVAYLAQTLLLGASIDVLPRHQPLAVPQAAKVMAVVRIQTRPGFRDTESMRRDTTLALAQVAARPGTQALQIDFDASRSQRDFYAAVLRKLRPQMPPGLPLSITALASWCSSEDGWLATLPIDEAVPMFFRLGAGTRPSADKSFLPIREPKCRTSVGISTDESWPALGTGRVYLFAPRPWTPRQLAAAAEIQSATRPPALRPQPGPDTPIRDTALHAYNTEASQ